MSIPLKQYAYLLYIYLLYYIYFFKSSTILLCTLFNGQSVVFTLFTGHSTSFSATKSPKPQKPKEKQNRVWAMGGSSQKSGSSQKELDYSDPKSMESYIEPARDV